MFVVSQQTFAWASLRVLNKVPLNDVLVIIAVTASRCSPIWPRPCCADHHRRAEFRLAAGPRVVRR
jgi:hypothetical protein